MAGDRHHILPRFLLKGFASRIEGEKIYTWVYPRNRTPIEANIRKVSVEKYFYGRQGELSVDDDITKFENEYAPFLDKLREYPERTEIVDPGLPKLITHLITRTKHIRELFRSSSEIFVEKMSEYFSDFNNIEAIMLGKYGKAEMEKKFREIRGSRSFRRKSKKLLKRLLPSVLHSQKNEMLILYQNTFENLKNALPRMIKQGHIEGLSKEITPNPRVEDYQQLKWFMLFCERPTILGDMGCLSETTGLDRFKFLTFKDDKIRNVFLPISDKKILIGTSLPELPYLNIGLLNEEIAKHSMEFFISSNKSIEISSLISLIGSENEIISRQELEQMAKEIFSEYSS